MTISSLRILKWSLPADESADASRGTLAARAMKLSAQQQIDEKLRLSAGRKKPASSSSLQPILLSDAMKKLTKDYEYGNCHTCGERMTERLVTQDFWIKGKLIVLDGVPAGVCPRCGERVVKSDVGRTVAELLTNQPRKRRSRTLNVPVILFKERVA